MPTALITALSLLAQPQPPPDPAQFPLVAHRSMEIDDLDREIQRLHDTVLLKRGQLGSTQRLARRGLVSRSDLERGLAALHHEEAREAEARAYRALKEYERDVLGRVVPLDESKAYDLLLDWLKTQEAIARLEVDDRGVTLKQVRSQYRRLAVSRQQLDDAELAYNSALAKAALNQSRQTRVRMERAARKGEKPSDPAEYERLKAEHLKARVRYFEIVAEGARNRLTIALERSRRGLIPIPEVAIFQKAADDAEAALAAERKKLENPGAS
ncbi:MAG: hypothetical protein JOZ53_11900 [Planctomycetaceae bacterium]|nr:hypothetical protein [Planctomycetaceae bacterium]